MTRCPTQDDGCAVPLCTDLDGTLVESDLLLEGALASLRRGHVIALLGAALKGRVALKHKVACLAPLDPALLPYNERLVAYLREEKARGRQIVLATAADEAAARPVARYLDLFDEVIASGGGNNNLKGSAKALALVSRFGAKGFAYAGNARADLAVWAQARTAILVNVPPGIARRARDYAPVEAEFPANRSRPAELLRAMRPHQWVKNLLVAVPLITAHALFSASAWFHALVAFVAFCATASSIYIINDLLDLEADRAHPTKRRRPFARGTLSIRSGALASVALVLIGVAAGIAVGIAPVILAYAGCSLAYSLKLKQLPLVDVFTLAALYTLRIYAGGLATVFLLSLWLLAFSSFLFLSLSLVKRAEEILASAQAGRGLGGRGYMPGDGSIIQMFGASASVGASVVLALFVQSDSAANRYASPELLWGLVPLFLFWQWRMWLSAHRGYMHDDPIVYAARDWVSWVVAAAAVSLITLAHTALPLGIAS